MAVICWLVSSLLSHPQANVAPEDDLIVSARAFLDALNRGDFQAAAGDFDATMMKVSGPDKLAEFWKQVPARLGAFKRQTAARRDRLGEYEVALVTCEFEKVTLDARINALQESDAGKTDKIINAPPDLYYLRRHPPRI